MSSVTAQKNHEVLPLSADNATEAVTQTALDRNAEPRSHILIAAADCFMQQGFTATSIDDVARRLSATKGMIYHHFRSKNDLFFAVYRLGMELNFASIDPYLKQDVSALKRLAMISHAHAVNMMAEQSFQRTLGQGVVMHQTGSTTAAQRATLNELIEIRDQYEAVFREAIAEVVKQEKLVVDDLSIAVKSFLAVLNSTVYWYSPRQENPKEEQNSIALNLVTYALNGLGAKSPENLLHLIGDE